MLQTLFKNTGMANPLTNSGDAVLVAYIQLEIAYSK